MQLSALDCFFLCAIGATCEIGAREYGGGEGLYIRRDMGPEVAKETRSRNNNSHSLSYAFCSSSFSLSLFLFSFLPCHSSVHEPCDTEKNLCPAIRASLARVCERRKETTAGTRHRGACPTDYYNYSGVWSEDPRRIVINATAARTF